MYSIQSYWMYARGYCACVVVLACRVTSCLEGSTSTQPREKRRRRPTTPTTPIDDLRLGGCAAAACCA